MEFKQVQNRYDFEELFDYGVAIANEGGGRIVLGVADNLPRKMKGIKAVDPGPPGHRDANG